MDNKPISREDRIGRAFQRGYRGDFHYLTPGQQEALARACKFLRAGQGHVLLTGSGGTGKTTLLKRVVEELRAKGAFVICFLVPSSSLEALTASLLRQMAPGEQVPQDMSQRMRALQSAVAKLNQRCPVVICVDEAQTVPDETLFGLLQAAGTDEVPALVRMPLMLVGTDELVKRLRGRLRHDLEGANCMTLSLEPLDKQQVAAYIRHQLHAAGIDEPGFIPDDLVEQIANLTGGVQSEVSSFCGMAAYSAQLEGLQRVTQSIVKQVSRDFWITPNDRIACQGASGEQADTQFRRAFGEVVAQRHKRQTERKTDHVPPLLKASRRKNAGTSQAVASEPAKDGRLWKVAAFAMVLASGSLAYLFGDRISHDPPQQAQQQTAPIEKSPSKILPDTAIATAAGTLRQFDASMLVDPFEMTAGDQQSAMASLPGELAKQLSQLPPPAAGGEPLRRTADEPKQVQRYAAQDADPPVVHDDVPDSGWRLLSPWTEAAPELIPVGAAGEPIRLRARPSTRAPVLDILPPGTSVMVTARWESTHWYKVINPRGDMGFVFADFARKHSSNTSKEDEMGRAGLHLIARDESEAARFEITSLLKRARRHLEADRLLSPRFDNALFLYREVLGIVPDHVAAQQGIEEIKQRLFVHSENARLDADLVSAKSALDKVLLIDSGDQQALSMLYQLEANPTETVAGRNTQSDL